MKVVVINNGSKEPKNVLDLLGTTGAKITLLDYTEADKVGRFEYDFAVLTGSSQFPITHKPGLLEKELSFVREAKLPILGICYGCQIMAFAFGAKLDDMGSEGKLRILIEIDVVKDDPIFNGKKSFEVYDAHRWVIKEIPENLEILAKSAHGPEVIRHRSKPQFGLQFHPERTAQMGGNGIEIFHNFLKHYVDKS
jgi:GMP synthase (glutamine-hydrolysing)